jgi:tetratricopeptide (TPR) repeat protein
MPMSTCAKPASEALLLASLLLAASPVAADYRESYRRGLEAASRGSWADAERFMRAALAEHPREGERVFVDGGRAEAYLPRYYIGLALYQSGNCVAARREWEAGRAAIQRTPFLKTVARLNQECQKRVTRETAAGRSASALEAEIRKAEKLAAAVAVLQSSASLPSNEREELDKGLREAGERLADARARLEDGRRDADLGDLDKARELTQRATADIEKTRRRAMGHLDPLASTPGSAALPPPSAAPAHPPAELVAAARAYFEGRYEDVIAGLPDAREEPGPAAVQAHLLRAAARFALYARGGRQDETLHRALRDDVQAVRRLDPTFEPDAAAFSPAFRELFRSGR